MTARSFRSRLAIFAFAGLGLVWALPASAEEPVETAIRSWVSALDASPHWVAGYAELGYDQGLRAATIKNLTIRSETLGTKLEVTFGTIVVTGYGDTADGGFTAVEIKADDNHAVFGDMFDMKMADIDISNFAVPSFTNVAFDQTQIFTSLTKIFAVASKATLDSMSVTGIEVNQTYEGQTSHSTVGSYQLKGMKNAAIDLITMGPFVQESPSQDGLVKMRIEKIEARQYDLDAVTHVFDADRYVSGTGDGLWRTALALESYSNFTVDIPGGQVRIGSFEVENLKLRQPPKSFASFFDQLLANPQMPEEEMSRLAMDAVPNIVSAFGFGAFRLSDVDVTAPEIERFHLGDFHINELSSDGIGEIGIADLDTSVQDKGAFGAERLALGGVVFPAMDRIVAAIKARASGIEADSTQLIPTMGYAEAINLDLSQGDKKLGSLDRGRLDLSAYIGPIPTNIAFDVRGLDLDLSLVDDARARQMLQSMGYDRLNADYGFKLAWREADESLRVDDFKLAIKDVGALSVDAKLTGLSRVALQNPKSIESVLPSLMFNSGKVVIVDKSVVGRAISMEAQKKNQTPEKYRKDLAGALPFTLMLVLKNPTFQAKLVPALQTFLQTPGTLTLTANPPAPVPLVKLIDAANNAPRTLSDLLSLDVQASQ